MVLNEKSAGDGWVVLASSTQHHQGDGRACLPSARVSDRKEKAPYSTSVATGFSRRPLILANKINTHNNDGQNDAIMNLVMAVIRIE